MFKNLLKSFQRSQPVRAAADIPQAEALIAAGNAAEDEGRPQDAHALYQRALALAPQLPRVHLNLGIVLEALGDAGAARACYQRVLAFEEGHPFGAYNLAKLEYVEGRLPEAESLLRRALARKADFFEAWVLLSNTLDAAGKPERAAEAIAQALALQADHAGASFNQAGLLRRLGRLDEAAVAAGRAAALAPAEPEYLALHGLLLYLQGFAAEALQVFRRAIPLAPDRLDLRSRELFLLNLVEGPSAAEIQARHRELGRQVEAAVPLRATARAVPKPRLRLGFVSEDFRWHPVSLFLLPLLEGRTRDRFEVFCYSNTVTSDEMTERIRALSDRWIDASALHDLQLADAIVADGIDILVDLGGHTGDVRLGVFAAKPAPVQIGWLGYLNTTGLTRMDYRLTDLRCDPPRPSEPGHTERLLHLPQSQWCYRPFVTVEAACEAPCERRGFITFGSFNNPVKLTDAMAARWGRLLRSVPQSRLLVAGVGSEARKDALRSAIERASGRQGHVEFAPRLDLHGYYGLMNEVDIALDSYPYGGGTTTFDALWMGVPVLTAQGESSASRSAASVLAALGLEEWIAPRIEDYETLALARAADRAGIANVRRTARERLRASPLMDERAFVSAFESALERAWEAAAA